MATPTDIAWAAGLFEGEGCISTSNSLDHRTYINVSTTDRDVLERFQAIVACGHLDERERPPNGRHWKQLYTWRASGADAERVVTTLLPYFGERRCLRALEVLAARDRHRHEVTAPRTCPGCDIEFCPRYSSMSLHQTYCSKLCYSHSSHGRAVKAASKRRMRAERNAA